MNKNRAYQVLKKRHQVFLLSKIVEALVYSSIVGLLLFFLLKWLFLQGGNLSFLLALGCACLSLIAMLFNSKFVDFQLDSYCQFLDEQNPDLENSSHLLTKTAEDLNSIEQFQQLRVLKILTNSNPFFSVNWKAVSGMMVLGIALSLLFYFVPPIQAKNTKIDADFLKENKSLLVEEVSDEKVELEKIEATLTGFDIYITPPTYTNLPTVKALEKDFEVLEGSKVAFKAKFDAPIEKGTLILGINKEVQLDANKQASARINNNTIYQIKYWTAGKEKFSDYFSIKARRDNVPVLSVKNKESYESIDFASVSAYPIQYKIEDDFLIEEVIFQTTISQGAGEQVQFRDSTWVISSAVLKKQINETFILPLPDLKINPGEEIYWQLKAKDNRPPNGQWAQSETFILHVEDTIRQASIMGSDLGVDLLPEYFRSQRQVIIDTEKTLSEKPAISTKEFQQRCNNTGYDQKILRLRYGKFLGEEFESASGGDVHLHKEEHEHDEHCDHSEESDGETEHKHGEEAEHEHDEDCEHNHEAVEHQHDEHCEHNHQEAEHEHEAHNHEESKATRPDPHAGHDHGEENLDPDKKENPIAGFAHFHDSAEEATFFDKNLQTKLRAALNEMWQAELFLRMHQPELALAYEYKALKLIKEIQQDSRVYVERVGLDLPKLKMEKRLTGDFEEVESKEQKEEIEVVLLSPNLKKLLSLLSSDKELVNNQGTKQILELSKQELLALIQEGNAPVLNLLKALDELIYLPNGAKIKGEKKEKVLKALSNILGNEPPELLNKINKLNNLEKDFLKRIY